MAMTNSDGSTIPPSPKREQLKGNDHLVSVEPLQSVPIPEKEIEVLQLTMQQQQPITDPAQVHSLTPDEIQFYRKNPLMFQNFLVQLQSAPPERTQRVFNPIMTPHLNSVDQVMRSPAYQMAIVSIEQFFASYIDVLFTKIEQLYGNTTLSEVVVNQAIILVKDLREMVTSHCFAQFTSMTADRDMFFNEDAVSRLTPVHEDDFAVNESISLGEYLRRYGRRYQVEVDPVLSCINSDVIKVGICARACATCTKACTRNVGAHYLIMPKHVTLLEAVISNKLMGPIGPTF